MDEKWLVFYTKSRSEKKVVRQLEKDGFEVFLPIQKVLKQWSDRKKIVETPLFNSYIFVYTQEQFIRDVLNIPGIAWNIRYNGKPAVIRDNEINLIKRFLSTGLFVETNSGGNFDKGDPVEVIDGPLKGSRGYVNGGYNEEKFTVIVDSIDQSLTVRIDGGLLKKV